MTLLRRIRLAIPRVVSRERYLQLTRQLPREQRKHAGLREQHRRLLAAHKAERHHHRVKVQDCEELKLLLLRVSPMTLASWTQKKQTETAHA